MIDYEKDILIDPNALDVEWLNQASLAMKYGKHYARCKRNLTLAEEKVKVTRSELIDEANTDPITCCGKEKPNAADIEAYYRNHKKHKAAKDEWLKASYELDIAEVAKSEISFSRKSALENLVRLVQIGYCAAPSAPRDLSFEAQKRNSDSEFNKKVSIGMKRRTK